MISVIMDALSNSGWWVAVSFFAVPALLYWEYHNEK